MTTLTEGIEQASKIVDTFITDQGRPWAREHLILVIAYALAEPVWQPIETVPKDGRDVDLWCVSEDGVSARRFINCTWKRWRTPEEPEWYDGDDYRLSNHSMTPTHWMRVAPPVTTMEKQP